MEKENNRWSCLPVCISHSLNHWNNCWRNDSYCLVKLDRNYLSTFEIPVAHSPILRTGSPTIRPPLSTNHYEYHMLTYWRNMSTLLSDISKQVLLCLTAESGQTWRDRSTCSWPHTAVDCATQEGSGAFPLHFQNKSQDNSSKAAAEDKESNRGALAHNLEFSALATGLDSAQHKVQAYHCACCSGDNMNAKYSLQ